MRNRVLTHRALHQSLVCSVQAETCKIRCVVGPRSSSVWNNSILTYASLHACDFLPKQITALLYLSLPVIFNSEMFIIDAVTGSTKQAVRTNKDIQQTFF
jgi:hypothetical protein